ncbi:hypothetical protein LFYK43_14440 [Ligilactobacillus salitolerans]|uniref:DUF1617 family protein n=1 Tax=Ligilactobacillus salitolerans TaxID=1808352 RepID=A0A401ITZ5_9LACO|nr:DUF1617 family protein [Ligilactobacillus salitolerans]GBG94985.1 hypothetical protein LFYK43_14440 [Ligilactobacillus salitolerans]
MKNVVKFRNAELVAIGNFLGNLNLKNMASLGRSKLIKLIVAKNADYQSDLNVIRDQFFEKNEDGEFKTEKGGQKLIYKNVSDRKEADQQFKNISDDVAVISITEYSNKFKKLYEALQNYEGEFSNQDALLYELVMDAFDKCFKDGKEE